MKAIAASDSDLVKSRIAPNHIYNSFVCLAWGGGGVQITYFFDKAQNSLLISKQSSEDH